MKQSRDQNQDILQLILFKTLLILLDLKAKIHIEHFTLTIFFYLKQATQKTNNFLQRK